MVVAVTRQERTKSHNVVTATSSLVVWLVSMVSMLPTVLLLLLRSPSSIDAKVTITLLNFQARISLKTFLNDYSNQNVIHSGLAILLN